MPQHTNPETDEKPVSNITFSESMSNLVKSWLPLTISLMVFSGSIVGIFFRTEDRLTRLEITTTYITKQLDLVIETQNSTSAQAESNGKKLDAATKEIKKNGTGK